MAGILSNKNRVLDVILTDIGRDQMNRGEFEVSFVSFSDKGAEYIDDGTGVAGSIDDRLFLEAYSSPSDEIIPEIDNEGDFLLTKKVSPTMTVNNGVLYEKTEEGYNQVDAFANIASFQNILTGRYSGLQILRTHNDTPDFEISSSSVVMNTEKSVDTQLVSTANRIKPLLVDPRFTGNINTLFLPPTAVNAGKETPLRAFNRFGPENSEANVLDEIRSKSWASARIELGTPDTFDAYNIIGQVFMKKDQSVRKYLVVDAGEFLNDKNEIIMQVYHLGFIYKDEIGTSKFSRAFSLVFHNRRE
tara:strand:- start:2001 stop:2909 length:909 start_codon:yes stop_codon:yes gene_type:complete